MENNLKEHWETVYATKTPKEVSWTQERPAISLDFISSFQLEKSASIIDIGGGDSLLVDFLLDLGYTNLSVLDISAHAIERAKVRLGEKASLVTWIVSDINDFEPLQNYDLWHDRAAFHFLTSQKDIERYVELVSKHVKQLVIGTFSTNGPFKCSGLEITQYDENELGQLFGSHGFEVQTTKREDHMTPFGTTQNFVFASMVKL
jgi:2-polyprenyl-3-methyl-5-hydroxy-6-metoxy-1,4-benzoquinol methylase